MLAGMGAGPAGDSPAWGIEKAEGASALSASWMVSICSRWEGMTGGMKLSCKSAPT